MTDKLRNTNPVHIGFRAIDQEGCSLWAGTIDVNGYPRLWDSQHKKQVYAHRAVYEAHFGTMENGSVVRRTCGKRLCVAPEHLRADKQGSNDVVVHDGFAAISLSSGVNAVIDAADYHVVTGRRWHQATKGYVASQSGRVFVYLHRFLLGVNDLGMHVDHADGDKLNNRRANLRVCTPSENQGNRPNTHVNNTSGYRGVIREKKTNRSKPWIAQITVNKRLKRLGSHHTREEAARAYDEAALEHFGEFARLNFPLGGSSE